VVRIFAGIVATLPARLLLVGDGPERARAQQLAEDLGIADSVLFLGKQTSVTELLACSDLFLLPSESESFGLVALEAMACGVPVVATRTGGVPEVVEHGHSGYLAPIGATAEMATAGIELLSDADRWRHASAAARHDAERFSTDLVIPRYERLYQEILAT
jgi:L-malate glycosyltransferase